MDGGVAGDATAAAVGAWESIRGFFTPATLFLVVNLVIGTIALTSRSHNQRRRRGGYNSHYDADARHHHHVQEQENQYYDQQQQEQQYVPPPPAPLARTSSVMDRLRSIGLYRFRSGDFPPEYAAAPAGADSGDAVAPAVHGDAHYARSRSEPAPVREKKRATGPSRMKKSSSEVRKTEVAPAPAPAWVVRAAVLDEEEDVVDARAEEFADSFAAQPPAAQQQQEEVYYEEQYVPPLRPAPLARTSSVLDRLRSFSLYRLRSGDLGPEAATTASTHDAATAAAAADEKKAQAAHYARSRSEPAQEQSKKNKKQQLAAAEAKMTKSSSEARKPAAAAQEEPEAESVDARADDFINSFRQQLQLQRLNSLLNYKQGGAK